ncbi:MAG: hypothetical protein K2M20_12525 [Lachnospiraceae bacterium]|nr:hypothetical protein [Lachnospiraceae bacterium]
MTDSEKLDLLLSEMQEVKKDVHLLKEDTQTLKGDVLTLKEDTQMLKSEMEKLNEKTDVLENRIIHINLMLENEIRVNIQRVAEGHLDLSRNLHEAMHPNNEVEMLAIRVGMLESDMRKVKEKLA